MTNAAYQAVLAELEKLLPPRAVSHMLKQGLAALGRTPATLAVDDIAPLLRGPLLAYLKQQLHGERAADAVEGIIARLHDPAARLLEQTPAWTEKLRTETEELTAKLSHYNLYFDWPEVQEFRSRVNEARLKVLAGADAREELDGARARLGEVEDRLAGELAGQTRRIRKLAGAAAALPESEDRQFRRLHTMIRQLEQGLEQQVLMPAELAHAEELLAGLARAGTQPEAAAAGPAGQLARLEAEFVRQGGPRTETGRRLRQLLDRLHGLAGAGPVPEGAPAREFADLSARAGQLLETVRAEAAAARSIAGELNEPGSLDRLLLNLAPGQAAGTADADSGEDK